MNGSLAMAAGSSEIEENWCRPARNRRAGGVSFPFWHGSASQSRPNARFAWILPKNGCIRLANRSHPRDLAKIFEKKYPGIAVQVERTGSERIFQRLSQERASNIFAADVLDSTDQALFLTWKGRGLDPMFQPNGEVAGE